MHNSFKSIALPGPEAMLIYRFDCRHGIGIVSAIHALLVSETAEVLRIM